jgi:hypothetical protein
LDAHLGLEKRDEIIRREVGRPSDFNRFAADLFLQENPHRELGDVLND